jgi:hypothetical protein
MLFLPMRLEILISRRLEDYAPWDNRSRWHILNNSIITITETLPKNWTLSQTNISAHISSSRSSAYTYILLHTNLLLSKIILHREYVPFLPMRGGGPKGLDLALPVQARESSNMPFGFWEQSAVDLFRAAQDLFSLLVTCNDWKVLVETPMTGFAAYMVATLGKSSLVEQHSRPVAGRIRHSLLLLGS